MVCAVFVPLSYEYAFEVPFYVWVAMAAVLLLGVLGVLAWLLTRKRK